MQHLFHSYMIYTYKHTFYIIFIHNFNIYSNPLTAQRTPSAFYHLGGYIREPRGMRHIPQSFNLHVSRWVWVVKTVQSINPKSQLVLQVKSVLSSQTDLLLWEKWCFIPCWWLIFQAHCADSFSQHSVVWAELFVPRYFYRLWGWKTFPSRQDIWTSWLSDAKVAFHIILLQRKAHALCWQVNGRVETWTRRWNVGNTSVAPYVGAYGHQLPLCSGLKPVFPSWGWSMRRLLEEAQTKPRSPALP